MWLAGTFYCDGDVHRRGFKVVIAHVHVHEAQLSAVHEAFFFYLFFFDLLEAIAGTRAQREKAAAAAAVLPTTI